MLRAEQGISPSGVKVRPGEKKQMDYFLQQDASEFDDCGGLGELVTSYSGYPVQLSADHDDEYCSGGATWTRIGSLQASDIVNM
jgi:hypothetical protein